MQPIFILTRAFAISALFIGALPISYAAPLYTTRPCDVGVSCPSATVSSVWGLINALIPGFASPEPSTEITELASPEHNTITVMVVVEEDGGILNKRDDLDIVIREPAEIEQREPEPEPMCLSAAFCKREPEIEEREPEPQPEPEPEPEPEPMCLSAAFCKREPEPEPEPVPEPMPEPVAEPEPMCLSAAFCK